MRGTEKFWKVKNSCLRRVKFFLKYSTQYTMSTQSETVYHDFFNSIANTFFTALGN